MPTSSMDKWPVEIKVEKVSSSSLNQNLDMYFISGLMNQEQCSTLGMILPILAKFRLENGSIVASTVTTRQQLEEILGACRDRSKNWRGQYQVVMKKFVQACQDTMEA